MNEDYIVNKFLSLQRSEYLSKADKERLEQFMDAFSTARSDLMRQLRIMNEIEVTKIVESAGRDYEEAV